MVKLLDIERIGCENPIRSIFFNIIISNYFFSKGGKKYARKISL